MFWFEMWDVREEILRLMFIETRPRLGLVINDVLHRLILSSTKIFFISEEACWYQNLNMSSKEVPRIWNTQQWVQQTLVTFYVLALMLMAQVVIPVHFRLYSKVQFQSWPISNVAIQLPPPFTKQQTNLKLTFISKKLLTILDFF